MAFHPDGTRLATAGRDRAVWLWDLARGEEVVRLPGHTSYVWSLAFSPDGTTLASGSGRLHGPPVGHRAAEDALPGPARGRGPAPEAERLVEPLWRQKNDPADVVAALRADRELCEALRHAALRAVLRRVRQTPGPAVGNPQDLRP